MLRWRFFKFTSWFRSSNPTFLCRFFCKTIDGSNCTSLQPKLPSRNLLPLRFIMMCVLLTSYITKNKKHIVFRGTSDSRSIEVLALLPKFEVSMNFCSSRLLICYFSASFLPPSPCCMCLERSIDNSTAKTKILFWLLLQYSYMVKPGDVFYFALFVYFHE